MLQPRGKTELQKDKVQLKGWDQRKAGAHLREGR